MSGKFIELLYKAESKEEIEELMESYNYAVLFEKITMFMSGYQKRPIQSVDETLDFTEFMIINNEEDNEQINKLVEMLNYINNTDKRKVGEYGLEQQELMLKRASEYYE